MGKTHPIVNKKADSKLIIFINKKSAFRRFFFIGVRLNWRGTP